MDYTPDKSALLKAQWDLIHNPENVQFAWTEDMEEGAMVNIFSLIDDIRKANSNEERILTVTQDKCPSGHYKNVKLGENRISLSLQKSFRCNETDTPLKVYVSLHCRGNRHHPA